MIWLRAVWAIFKGSFPLQIATAVLLGWGALKANNAYQRYVGASQHAEKAEKEASNNAKTADAVRDAVGAGARGVRDPSRRDP